MPPRGHDHVVLTLEDGNRVVFNDHRRFGLMTLTTRTSEGDHPLLAHLASDPLDEAFTPATLFAGLAGRKTPIKAALLTQTIVGGVGNSFRGPFVGALVLIALPEMLRFLEVPGTLSGQLRLAVYGLLLVLLMHFRPQGLAGEYRMQ